MHCWSVLWWFIGSEQLHVSFKWGDINTHTNASVSRINKSLFEYFFLASQQQLQVEPSLGKQIAVSLLQFLHISQKQCRIQVSSFLGLSDYSMVGSRQAELKWILGTITTAFIKQTTSCPLVSTNGSGCSFIWETFLLQVIVFFFILSKEHLAEKYGRGFWVQKLQTPSFNRL